MEVGSGGAFRTGHAMRGGVNKNKPVALQTDMGTKTGITTGKTYVVRRQQEYGLLSSQAFSPFLPKLCKRTLLRLKSPFEWVKNNHYGGFSYQLAHAKLLHLCLKRSVHTCSCKFRVQISLTHQTSDSILSAFFLFSVSVSKSVSCESVTIYMLITNRRTDVGGAVEQTTYLCIWCCAACAYLQT